MSTSTRNTPRRNADADNDVDLPTEAATLGKAARIKHANTLFAVIASHGRRFFYNAQDERTARMQMSRSGHLYFVDEYRGRHIYLSKRPHWRGFSHGGTLRSLVDRIAEYVRTGEPMDRWPIAPKRSMDGGFDMWGYGDEACAAVQAEAFKIPMFKDAS